jgi:DNA polymerase IV
MRDILHLHIPHFPIAVARVADTALRERPVAVVPGHSERALLQAVSAEARADGVREGMPVYQARRFCPALVLIPPDPPLMNRATDALLELAGRYSPVWEPACPGRLYLDLTGCGRLLGPGRDAAARLEKEAVKCLRLRSIVGVAGNKLVSRIASACLTTPGVCDVLRGSEERFIGPLPVTVLPGVGTVRQILLEELNLRRVEQVGALSVAQLRLAFGSFAPLLRQRALGIDPSAVRPPRQSPEVSEETFLPRAENDDEILLAALGRLAESCGFRLRRQCKGTRQLALTIHYADGMAERRTHLFPAAENRDDRLLAAAEELFRNACRRRVQVKGMGLVCARLEIENRQLDLFAAPAHGGSRLEQLQEALDQLRGKYDMTAVRRWLGRSIRSDKV